MERIEYQKCMTVTEMVLVVSSLSNMDTALDVINQVKYGEVAKLEFRGNKLQIKRDGKRSH